MKCPHCEKNVSLFSNNMTKWGKVKYCPHCSNPVKPYLSLKMAVILFVPFVIAALLLKPVFTKYGLGESFSSGLATALICILSFRLKKHEA